MESFEYFLVLEGKTLGPFTKVEIIEKRLELETPIWCKSMKDWGTLRDMDFISIPPPFINNAPPVKNDPPPFQNSNYETWPTKQKKSNNILQSKNNFLWIAVGVIIFIVLFVYFTNNFSNTNSKSSSVDQNTVSSGSPEQNAAPYVNTPTPEDMERERINNEITKKNMEYRNNWQNYIIVDFKRPKIFVLGGVGEFGISIANNTDYVLDEVIVQIDYFKSNGALYKNEVVLFTNVAGNSTIYGMAPSSPYGQTVNVSIIGIKSKKMHFCFPDGSLEPLDPYKCK